jgi:hypothetical protein
MVEQINNGGAKNNNAKIVLVLIDGLSDTDHKDLGCKRHTH